MKKVVLSALFALLIVISISWGYVGHQTVALIAERHLTREARQAVHGLLGNQSIGDIASWADEIRDAQTFPEHFINAPLGLTRSEFEKEVKTQGQDNVYKAILSNEAVLKDAGASVDQKQRALKFIVHFVGDLHQPFHVSRKEDKGGNTIQVQFEGKGTNLHSLWDSKLIDREGLTSSQMVTSLDKATPAQIKAWQSDSLMQWIWESYQISTRLYDEAKPGSKLGDDYYQSHVNIVNERIEQAGIRLAGLLNGLFLNVPSEVKKQHPDDDSVVQHVQQPDVITLEAAGKQINQLITTTGKVYSTKNMGSFVMVNMGADYPNQLLTVILRGKAKDLTDELKGKEIWVTGVIVDYKGRPEIVVNDPSKIKW